MKTIVYVGELRSFDILCRDLRDRLLQNGITNFNHKKGLSEFTVNNCTVIRIPNELSRICGRKMDYVMCNYEIALREIRDRKNISKW